MSDCIATEAIYAQAHVEARSIAYEYGWETVHTAGVLKAYLTDMEHCNETPTEYARRQGWIE